MANRNPLSLAVAQFKLGKKLPDAVYVHKSALPLLPVEAQQAVARAVELAGNPEHDLLKFAKDGTKVSLLSYPNFLEEGFPALRRAWTVDMGSGAVVVRNYGEGNPPILHRKEQFVASDHPMRQVFAALTDHAVSLGLFSDLNRIGMKSFWEKQLQAQGLRVVGHEIVKESP